ncbi:MAG: hypothetical protein RMJ56_13425 [Gemmataceae bacterium]|nr:hypothetical protein [Gemmata sp.]MDW8198593.1 hypothetical protein [Gemmataceae bacterium]
MSIVRVGMAEDEKFGAGYDAIFGKKDNTSKKSAAKTPAKKSTAKATAKKSTKKNTTKKK